MLTQQSRGDRSRHQREPRGAGRGTGERARLRKACFDALETKVALLQDTVALASDIGGAADDAANAAKESESMSHVPRVLFAAICVGVTTALPAAAQNEVTERFSRTAHLDQDGTFDLTNVTGDIVITGGSGTRRDHRSRQTSAAAQPERRAHAAPDDRHSGDRAGEPAGSAHDRPTATQFPGIG